MEVLGIAITSVPVSDQDRARDFYVDILGFSVLEDEAMGPGMRWVRLGLPAGGCTLTLVTWFPSMAPGSLKGLLMAVADIEATAAELAAKGVECSGIEAAPWGRYVQLADPDGNGIVLQQHA